uniref:C2H2-type domain-containing protein n=1 Tax=Oryza brachyantha TaxID=4533 RepID=J3M0G5_ORYBR
MASNSSAAAAAAFFGISRDGDQHDQIKPLISQQQQQQLAAALPGVVAATPTAASSQGAPAAAPPAKKKRNLPGNQSIHRILTSNQVPFTISVMHAYISVLQDLVSIDWSLIICRSGRGGDSAVAEDAAGDEPVRVRGVQQGVPAGAEPAAAPARAQPAVEAEAEEPGAGAAPPHPDAEVIALSPKTLLATNRFVCEVCNKGFQREQNLQLHRRGHNLPWKLKQKNPAQAQRRRVYLCPEPTCVHHDPSRALGDLTGIKKHFCRKHGEKKWKCEKCSKRYAVQSDWKAHSKICGTREYRCDCGTLFSRVRVLFGRAHSLELVAASSLRKEEPNARREGEEDEEHVCVHSVTLPCGPTFIMGQRVSSSPVDFGDDAGNGQHSFLQAKPFHGLMQLPDLQGNGAGGPGAPGANLFNLGFFANNGNSSGSSHEHASQGLMSNDQFSGGAGGGGGSDASAAGIFGGNFVGGEHVSPAGLYNDQAAMLPQMSATALLQKAAQMGATSSANGAGSMFRGFAGSSPHMRPASQHLDQSDAHLNDLMNSLAGGGVNTAAMFGATNGGTVPGAGMFDPRLCDIEHEVKFSQGGGGAGAGTGDGTRDFLGVGGGGIVHGMSTPRGDHHQSSSDMSSLEAEMKSASSFNGRRMP